MTDQCKHCTVRGDLKTCLTTECFQHESWYAIEQQKRISLLERLLADCASIIYKLGDENTYRIHETSPVMSESLNNLEQAIRRIVNP